MPDPIIKVNNSGTNKIVTINGQILQAPVGTLSPATYNNPVATKGTVSNNSINITPSFEVTSSGSINTGTISGTPVIIQASELVNGAKNITTNASNIDVTNYATVNVNVSGGGNNQSLKNYTVSASGNQYISPDGGYDGMNQVALTVPALTLPSSTSSSASGALKLTIIPSTTNKYINIPTGYNTTASYYAIQGDADLIANNIKNGVSIFGVTGTYEGSTGGYVANVTPTNDSFVISNVSFSPTKILGMSGYGASQSNRTYGFYFVYNSPNWNEDYYYSNARTGGTNSVNYNASTQTLTITNTTRYPFLELSYWYIFYIA